MNTPILHKLVEQLENIAEENEDAFRYRIDLRVERFGELTFTFVAEETADNHVFVEGRGKDIEDAALCAMADVAGACKQWGYTL